MFVHTTLEAEERVPSLRLKLRTNLSHRTLANQILRRLVLIFKTSELILPIIFDLLHRTLWKRNVVEVAGLLLAILTASLGFLYIMMNTVAAIGYAVSPNASVMIR